MGHTKNMKLQTGDVLHCRRNGFLARAIRWFTKSKYNHTAIVIECWGQTYVVDAQRNGVTPKPLHAWLEKYEYDIVLARSPGDFDEKAMSIRAFSKVGLTGYDFTGLIFKHPWQVITGRWKKKPNDSNKMVCSEYVAWVWQIPHAYRLSPQDIYDYTQYAEFTHYKFEYSLWD